MTSHLSKYREKQHANEFGIHGRFFVDLAYFNEPVVNAFQVVSYTRINRHFQQNVK